MAYVRTKGNQLCVVHGRRDPETGRVEQQTLFTLYSKAEARAAVGEQRERFRGLLRGEFPELRFDWAKIEAGIEARLDDLPDRYPYKAKRLEQGFDDALVRFAKALIVTDPQQLLPSAQLLQRRRHELEWLRSLIDFRLRTCEQAPSRWNQDNPFYWRVAAQHREVPPEEDDALHELLHQHRDAQAAALARLLTQAWPDYADGHSVLGRLALRDGQPQRALEHFDEAIRAGRARLPRRIAKARWWSDHTTRPYIRALACKVTALGRAGDFDGALAICDRLAQECQQDLTADAERAALYLNLGRWAEAAQAAARVGELFPDRLLLLALALAEQGQRDSALVALVRGAIQRPHTAHLLADLSWAAPADSQAAEDHNAGLELRADLASYLGRGSGRALPFVRAALKARTARAVLDEYLAVYARWLANRGPDRTDFDRLHAMKSEAFAASVAPQIIQALA